MKDSIIIKNASQLVTCSGFKAKQGKAMSDLHIIDDGAVVIENGVITAVGKTGEVLSKFEETGFKTIDATEKAVLPGFVDSHTHFVFAGYRAEEFSLRLAAPIWQPIWARFLPTICSMLLTKVLPKWQREASWQRCFRERHSV
jgi:imidazolonepropionase